MNIDEISVPSFEGLSDEQKATIFLLLRYRFRLESEFVRVSNLMAGDFTFGDIWKKPGDCTIEVKFNTDQPRLRAWLSTVEANLSTSNIFPVIERDCFVANFSGPIRKKLVDRGGIEKIITDLGPELKELGFVFDGEKKIKQNSYVPKDEAVVKPAPVQQPIAKKEESSQVVKDKPLYVEQPAVKIEDNATVVTFLGTLRSILSPVIPMTELTKQQVLKKYEGRNDTAELKVNDEFLLSRVLKLLERRGYNVLLIGQFVIISTDVNVITSHHQYKKNAESLSVCRKWFDSLRAWFSANSVNAEIISHPLLVVLSNYEIEIEIEGYDRQEAAVVAEFFRTNGMGVRQNIRMVYARISVVLAKAELRTFDVQSYRSTLKEEAKDKRLKMYETTDYDMFKFLSFNRPPDMDHVASLAKSIRDFSFIDPLTIAYTNCVTNTYEHWIVDGQHGLLAAKSERATVYYVIVHVETLEELVRMIAVLNNKRKLWQLIDYLRAWSSLKISIYQKIQSWMGRLPFTTILQAFSKKDRKTATEGFKAGEFREDFTIDANQVLVYLEELKKFIPKTTTVITGVLWFIIRTSEDGGSYNHEKLKARLQKEGTTLFLADDDLDDVTQKIKELYAKA